MKREATLPNCETCGRFMICGPGSSWKLVIPPDYWNGPDRELYRCRRCTERLGPLKPDHRGAQDTAGVIA